MISNHYDDLGHEWWGSKSEYTTTYGFRATKRYYHRVDGPAIVYFDGEKRYYLFNIRISEDDFYTPGFIDSYILEHS